MCDTTDTSTLTNPILQTPPNPCNLSKCIKRVQGNKKTASDDLKFERNFAKWLGIFCYGVYLSSRQETFPF